MAATGSSTVLVYASSPPPRGPLFAYGEEDAAAMLPMILRALGLGPGDRLVVRGQCGDEREVPLTCLDVALAGEVLGS